MINTDGTPTIANAPAAALPRGFRVHNDGSLYLVRPLDEHARLWLEENVGDDSQWFAGALVVEPRYIVDLFDGIVDAGFAVS